MLSDHYESVRVNPEHPQFFAGRARTACGLTPRGFTARWDLFLIKAAYDRGCDFSDLASSWSQISNLQVQTLDHALTRALNFLFPLPDADEPPATITVTTFLRAPTAEAAAIKRAELDHRTGISENIETLRPLALERGPVGTTDTVWSLTERIALPISQRARLTAIGEQLRHFSDLPAVIAEP